MAENLLTKAAFAAVMGVDRAQPTRWAQRGMPVVEGGMVDAVRAAEWVRSHLSSEQRNRRSIGAREMGEVAHLRKQLVIAYTVGDESAASYAAELLLPHLPEATVRAIAAELLRRMRVGSAECLGEELPPPSGCTSWLEAPAFNGAALWPADWEDLQKRLAAGELVKVDA